MRVLRWLRTAVTELLSLVVDDPWTFGAAAIGLVATYFVAHDISSLRAAAGFGLLAIVWCGLALSFFRAVRRR